MLKNPTRTSKIECVPFVTIIALVPTIVRSKIHLPQKSVGHIFVIKFLIWERFYNGFIDLHAPRQGNVCAFAGICLKIIPVAYRRINVVQGKPGLQAITQHFIFTQLNSGNKPHLCWVK